MIDLVITILHDMEKLEDSLHNKIDDFDSRLADDVGYVDEVQRIIGEGQMERNAREVDPTFMAWAENSPTYRAAKGNLPIGVLTGDMLSPENIMGRPVASRGTVTIQYAGDAFAQQKLRWFEASGRKAWGLDDSIRAKLRELVGEKLGASLHNVV